MLAAISLVLVVAVLAFLLKSGLAWRLAIDLPNNRSLHTRPTPRVGGLGIVPVASLLIWMFASSLWFVALIAALLAALSQVDDRRGLPARVRFIAHLIAVAVLSATYRVPMPWWNVTIVAILLLWLVNLYNFMDGADGLAGGMAVLGFSSYAIAALISVRPDAQLAAASAAVTGAAAGFLIFNFHPARIFMGDAGSIPLGFLAGALGYWGWREGAWPVWFPPFTFAPFIFDASVTLFKRLLHGEKFWHAHREHYYQRMIRLGISHGRAAMIWYFVMTVGIMLALAALQFVPIYQWMVVLGWGLVLVAIGYGIDRRWRSYVAGSPLFESLEADDQI